MGRPASTTKRPAQQSEQTPEDKIIEADKQRLSAASEETVAQADEERMLATRRETELQRLAGDLPDDPAALWMYAEHSMMQEAVSCIDSGRALLKLKERLPHGEFMAGLEDRGIQYRTAKRKIDIAVKFSERSEKLLKLGRTKLYGCLDFTDDELDTLEEGGSVLDLTLDDLDRKTTRELKDLIKKGRADNEVKDKLLGEKNSRIDELATDLERTRGELKPGEPSPLVQRARTASQAGIIALTDLMACVQQVEEGDLISAGAIHAALEELRPMFAAVREEHLTRFPNLHLAMDDAASEPWQGQQH